MAASLPALLLALQTGLAAHPAPGRLREAAVMAGHIPAPAAVVQADRAQSGLVALDSCSREECRFGPEPEGRVTPQAAVRRVMNIVTPMIPDNAIGAAALWFATQKVQLRVSQDRIFLTVRLTTP